MLDKRDSERGFAGLRAPVQRGSWGLPEFCVGKQGLLYLGKALVFRIGGGQFPPGSCCKLRRGREASNAGKSALCVLLLGLGSSPFYLSEKGRWN